MYVGSRRGRMRQRTRVVDRAILEESQTTQRLSVSNAMASCA